MAAAAAGAGAGANYPITPPGGAVALNTTWQRAEWVSHSGPLFRIVQEALRPSPCADVKPLLASIVQHLQRTDIFGPNEWQKFFNARVPRAPVSLELDTVLQAPCPFWPERLVRDTHEVVYVPAEANGKVLTCVEMRRLVRAAPPTTPVVKIILPVSERELGVPRVEDAIWDTNFSIREDQVRLLRAAAPPTFSYWALISKEPIPGSIRYNPIWELFTYSNLTALIPDHARAAWQAPLFRDALICITTLFVQTGNWLYPDRNIQTRHAETAGGTFVVRPLTTNEHDHEFLILLDCNRRSNHFSSGLAVARTFGEERAAAAAKV